MRERENLPMQVDEILYEQESGRVDSQFFLEFSQRSPRGEDYSPQKTKKLSDFLNSGERALFILLMQGGKQKAKAAIFLSGKRPLDAYLGCFEAQDEPRLTSLVLQAAVSWARQQGVRTVYGPIDKSTWQSYRYRTDEEAETFPWEPARQSYEEWKKFGFQLASRYHSTAYRQTFLANMRLASYLFWWPAHKAQRLGYRVAPFHADWKENLETVYRIALDAFDSSYLFEPISFAEFTSIYAQLGQKLDFRPSFFLINPSGEAVGFVLAYYDAGYLVVKSLGILSSCQGSGLGRCLAYAVLKAGADDGLKAGIAALIRTGNRTDLMAGLIKRLGVTSWTHTYELLAYPIED